MGKKKAESLSDESSSNEDEATKKPVKKSVAASSDDSRDESSESEKEALSSTDDSSSEEETAKPSQVEIKVEVVTLSSDSEDDPVAVAARRYLRLVQEMKEARKTLKTMDYGKIY